jgi:hypothetical protein
MTAREPMTIQVTSIVPILHIFDIAKAGKLYQGFLGFKRPRSLGEHDFPIP